MRAPSFLLIASALVLTVSFPIGGDAQQRVARPRTSAPAQSVAVARPRATVFRGGYYYPSMYRTSLYYGGYYGGWGYPAFYGGYGWGYPGFSVGFGWGYPGYYAGWGYPYAPYAYPFYGPGYYYDPRASVRLQIAQREAEVFVDGFFAGKVDSFDGTFQRLNVIPGEHEIQVYLPGHRLFQQRVYLQPGKTFNIKHALEPLAPGEPVPPRPEERPRPAIPPYAEDGEGGGPPPPEVRSGRPGEGTGRGQQAGPRPVQGFGSLSLRVQPADAEVLIDGEAWQGSLDNDRLVVQLGTGTHHIEIRKEGYRSYLTDVTIGDGLVRTLNVALTKQ